MNYPRVFAVVIAASATWAASRAAPVNQVPARRTGVLELTGGTSAAFSPSINQVSKAGVRLASAGTITIAVVDRDRAEVRTLLQKKLAAPGALDFSWDGRDDRGEVVPDEAYSFKIDFVSNGKTDTYFPASKPAEMLDVKVDYYNRTAGTLSYTLPRPARLHVQAGIGRRDPKTGEFEGVVMKTIVNREPRAAGAVVETWNGFDESGTVYFADDPEFVISIMATALPEGSVITTGNRKATFLEYAAKRKAKSLLPKPAGHHGHHQGLTAFEDVSPPLKLGVEGGTWSSAEKTWRVPADRVKVSVTPEGLSAPAFLKQPGTLYVFLDGKQIEKKPAPKAPTTIEVSLAGRPAGSHILAVNWASEYGPTAAIAARIAVGEARGAASGEGGPRNEKK